MTQGAESFIVLVGISIVSSFAMHSWKKKLLPASVFAALAAAISFQVFFFLKLGYVDAFFLISFATTSVLALGIALLVGLPFHFARKRRAIGAAPREAVPVARINARK